MKLPFIKFIVIILLVQFSFSCAPPKQFKDLQIENQDCLEEREMINSKKKLFIETLKQELNNTDFL